MRNLLSVGDDAGIESERVRLHRRTYRFRRRSTCRWPGSRLLSVRLFGGQATRPLRSEIKAASERDRPQQLLHHRWSQSRLKGIARARSGSMDGWVDRWMGWIAKPLAAATALANSLPTPTPDIYTTDSPLTACVCVYTYSIRCAPETVVCLRQTLWPNAWRCWCDVSKHCEVNQKQASTQDEASSGPTQPAISKKSMRKYQRGEEFRKASPTQLKYCSFPSYHTFEV